MGLYPAGEWSLIEPLLPAQRWGGPAGGRPEAHPRREIVNAIRYLVRSGCAWRALPADFPPWQTLNYVSVGTGRRRVERDRGPYLAESSNARLMTPWQPGGWPPGLVTTLPRADGGMRSRRG
jgi:hypothetical protein